MTELNKLTAIHELVRTLIETKNYDGVKLLGTILLDSDISTKKTYMVATKSLRDELGTEREELVESYNKEMIDKGHTPI